MLSSDVAARARHLVGRVRSVHRAGVWIDLEKPGELLAIALDDVGGIPGGILVSGTDDLRTCGIRPGMALRPVIDGLAIAGAGVRIPTGDARIWSPALPDAARLRWTATERRNPPVWVLARDMAAGFAPAEGLGPLLGGHLARREAWFDRSVELLDRLTTALLDGDEVGAREPIVELIGLGPGLTPSGDDAVVGFLAGLDATGHPARRALAAVVDSEAAGRTTAIGASLLGHAARGAHAQRVRDVLAAIAAARNDLIAASVARAMAYGATSGADTLVGLFAAIGIAWAGSVGQADPADPARPAWRAA